MSWRESFNKGISSFQQSRLDEALQHFNEAIEQGGDQQYIVYDSRAAVYERLERFKDALRDTKKVIGVAQDRWQGYARAARLFLRARKFDASLTMSTMALDRLKPGDTKRRAELTKLKEDILEACKAVENQRRSTQYHFGKLPVEIFGEIFRMIVAEDSAKLVIILHVCQHWRRIIWHTPSLWDTLVLTHRHPGRKITQWVTRSRGIIRELRVRAEAVQDLDWPHPRLRDIQWDKLRVCNLETWDIAEYLESISMSHIVANLETLELNDCSSPSRLRRGSIFLKESRIQSLTMLTCNFSWNSFPGCLGGLTSLVVRDCMVDGDLWPALEANPHLETLIMENTFTSSPSFGTRPSPLSLPKLRHLDIGGSWVSKFLEQLVLPEIQTLHVRRGVRSLNQALHGIVEGGPTNLSELCISHCSLTSLDFINFLQLAPSLQTLELSHLSNIANSVVEALATPRIPSHDISPIEQLDSRLMCPALTHLNLSHSPDIKTGPLTRLVKSRLPPISVPEDGMNPTAPTPARITSLKVDGCPQIDAEWVPWLRDRVPTFSCIYLTKKMAAWRR